MKKYKNYPAIFLLIFIVFFNLNVTKAYCLEATSYTRVTFNLRSGSQLFISYPVNIVQTRELIIYEVKKDSSFSLDIYSETPFTLSNLNRQNTQYVFFPNFEYETEITKTQISFEFICTDKHKQFECNILSEMEKTIGKMNISEEDGNTYFNKLVKGKIYTHELDSFYASKYKFRKTELIKLKDENKISSNGFNFLIKYIECSFVRNRFMPFYYGEFEKKKFPNWYKDSMLQYIKYFDDTILINTKSYKAALRCMNLFLALVENGNSSFIAQFLTAKNFSEIDIVNEMMMFSVFDAPMNKKDTNYSTYIDSLKTYESNEYFKSILLLNYNYSMVKGLKNNDLIVNRNNEIFKFDSLIREKEKIIIIEFWATWCIPCIKELSTVNKFITEMGDANISYIFLSMDEDYNKWKNSISNYSFMNSENSFILKGGFESNLAKSNFIKAIPYYSIYKNDGTIIKNGFDKIQNREFINNVKKLINANKE